MEPIGSQRLPNINILNVRAEKRITVAKGQTVALGLNVFNATNAQTATTITQTSGSSFGVVTARLLPRYMEFQLQYRF